ncbi:MAG: DinB family protein [candidate division Zixibacteria bacterium]|nr:DinB family protein [candidate division Zixibacteria bacterium]
MKLSDLFSHWETIRNEMIEGIGSLTQRQLDWKPSGWKSSIADLLRHISETELWWIGNVVLRKDNYQDLTASMAPDLKSIIKELEVSHRYVFELVNSKTIDNLDEIFKIPKSDEKLGLKWILWHTIEHEMRHRGQIFMIMRLQGIAPPNV